MSRFALLIAVVSTVLAISHAQTDYCAASLCGSAKHIACNNNGAFLPACPANAKMVTLTANMQTILLNAHNTKRNYVAGGNVKKFPAACRMATMQWDAELAKLAALNVRQCVMAHDECRSVPRFKYSGQNLAIMGSTSANNNHAANLKEAVNMWYSEIKDTKLAHIKSYPSTYSGPMIGHFTVMVAEKNNRVGCGAVMYNDGKYNQYLVACNYAYNNIYDYPIYKGCTKAGAQCKKGVNPKYKNLCAPAEVYAVNKI